MYPHDKPPDNVEAREIGIENWVGEYALDSASTKRCRVVIFLAYVGVQG